MVNEELYLRKLANTEEIIEHFGGKACDPSWMPQYMKYIKPYVRDYSKQKTAAIAEPAPREKRLRDYLALDKVKHGLNALGGIGLATNGVLLLNKETVPAQTLGTALAMGGTYIAGKNMHDLINDFSKKQRYM